MGDRITCQYMMKQSDVTAKLLTGNEAKEVEKIGEGGDKTNSSEGGRDLGVKWRTEQGLVTGAIPTVIGGTGILTLLSHRLMTLFIRHIPIYLLPL